MILVPCVHCGPRPADEFRHEGEVRPRPDPRATDPEEWRRYLYDRRNPSGWVTERWFHRNGCRTFFVAERHTLTNRVRASRLPAARLRLEERA